MSDPNISLSPANAAIRTSRAHLYVACDVVRRKASIIANWASLRVIEARW